jgi:ABC-type branched-subunit amino acid transport system ATPase component
MTETPLLHCRDVTVRFGGVVALDGVSVDVPGGAAVGLVGPNGAGKSTLFGVLTGLTRPASGAVSFDGQDITGLTSHARSRLGLARTFQQPELFASLTVRQHLVLARRLRYERGRIWSDLLPGGGLRRAPRAEAQAVDATLDLLGLGDVADQVPASLPLGSRRLLEVGRSLASDPKIVLLDEPGAGLDPTETRALSAALVRARSERGVSLLLVEHDLEFVFTVCESIYVLDFGVLIAHGTAVEVLADQTVRNAYLGATSGVQL